MKNSFYSLVLFFLLFIVLSAQAQSRQGFADAVLGVWEGGGTLFKQMATFNMEWETKLNDKFIKLTFKNSFKAASGVETTMSANAYYHLEQRKGHWFDSRGMMLPLKLDINGQTMTVLWGDESTERGKTIYSVIDKEHINVQDFVFRDNLYLLFGEANYKRVKK